MARGHACISVDLDSLWCYREIHGLERRVTTDIDAAYSVGVGRLLDFFAERSISVTLFAIGRDAERPAHAAILREAVRRGHEVASHSYAHDYALRSKRMWEIRDDLRRAHAAIGEACGEEPVGFRTPGYNVDPKILSVCAELGYRYDSSVLPCPPYWLAKGAVMAWLKLRGRPSRSQMTRPETLAAPLRPYKPHATQFWRRDESSRLPMEIPMAVLPAIRVPIIGTSLHLLGVRGFRAVMPLIERTHPSLFNLEFHAIDFMDADDPGTGDLRGVQPDLSIPWERKAMLYESVCEALRAQYEFAPLREALLRSADPHRYRRDG